MKPRSCFRRLRAVAGNSVVELALVLPLLLFLVIGVIDFGRAIHFNNILVSLSREGGHLAARTNNTADVIIKVLNATASPLDMTNIGVVYITEVKGIASGTGGVTPTVQNQYATIGGNTAVLTSQVYKCSSGWDGSTGKCKDPAGGTAILPSGLSLNVLETVHVVETMYKYEPIAGPVSLPLLGVGLVPVMQGSTKLYSQTIL